MFCRIRNSFDKVLSAPASGRRGGEIVGRSDRSDRSDSDNRDESRGVAWDCGPVRVESCSCADTTLIPRPLLPPAHWSLHNSSDLLNTSGMNINSAWIRV